MIDDVELVAGWLVELAREHRKGRMEITPADAQELVALSQVAKKVIIRCISVPPTKGGEAEKARGDSVPRKI